MSDLISRQAAVEAVRDHDWMQAVFTIAHMPSVEPEKCSDCIDREALLRKLQKVSTESWKMKLKCNAETVWNQCIDYVKDAPSVDPEREPGKWVDVPQYSGILFECDFCHKYQGTIKCKYCPNCGAKMEVDG